MVTFAASTGMLKLETPSTFSGKIFNFAGSGRLSGSDQIDLTNINSKSVKDSYANGVLTVTDGTNTDKLNFNGSYTLANFSFLRVMGAAARLSTIRRQQHRTG